MNWGRKIIREYYDDGVLKSEVSYKWGKRSGRTRKYFKNGNLMIEANFKNDIPNGRFREYYDNGNLMAEENYQDGRLVNEKRFDKNGKISGVAKAYYKSGQVRIEANFVNGVPDGSSKEYYENGMLMSTEYYRSGVMTRQERYGHDGMIGGFVTEFYDDGSVKAETDHKEGQYKEYYSNGTLKIEARFRNNKPHGVIKEYYDTGMLAAEDGYENGILVGSRRYDPSGNLMHSSGQLKVSGEKEEEDIIKEFVKQHTLETLNVEAPPQPLGEAEKEPEKPKAKVRVPRAKISAPPVEAPIPKQEAPITEEEVPLPEAPIPKQEVPVPQEKVTSLKEEGPTPRKEVHILTKEKLMEEEGPMPAEKEMKKVLQELEIQNVPEKPKKASATPDMERIENIVQKELKKAIAEEEASKPQKSFDQREGDLEPARVGIEGQKVVKEYYPSGSLKAEKRFISGELNGLTKEYYETGELLGDVYYRNGKIEHQTRYDKQGRFIYRA